MAAGTPYRQFPFVPDANIELPHELRDLYELTYNLWWAWTPAAQDLFALIDSEAWAMYRAPVQLLINVQPQRWQRLLDDETFSAAYTSVIDAFHRYMNGASQAWFARTHPDAGDRPVAYFSMEYGLHQSMPFYAGGLGILSGDHLKSASDLGVPLIGVGLLYRRGYFRQTVDPDGLQQHTYVENDFTRQPVRPVAGPTGGQVTVRVPFPGREVHVGVWTAQVGRVPLLLLSTDVAENDPADRPVTDILYVPTPEVRLAQEVVLGVGGVRALRALGVNPGALHINEGHSTYAVVERLRELIASKRVTADEAVQLVRRETVFTTHTPVPAGNERYEAPLAARYLEAITRPSGIGPETMLPLGHADGGDPNAPFNLTAVGVRTAGYANAVSVLNAEVCNAMWRHVRPETPDGQPVIHPITNGIHTATWTGRSVGDLYERHLGARWDDLLLDQEAWKKVLEIPDEDVWAAHLTQKTRLARFIRARLREQFARHGRTPDDLRALENWFDPNVLTIGFARRFATYKRVWLVFSNLDRFRALVANADRPVQIVFAGKAHPADRAGQELIRSTVGLEREKPLRGRVFFLEDYDMRVARMLVQGVDVWLNTPRRPMEASGTSGQKAAANGALNVSILDGWWPEAYDGHNGWVVQAERQDMEEGAQDHADAEALYRVLEEQVVPSYYRNDARGLPADWIAMMKQAMATITPNFSAARMLRDYVEQAYAPAMRRSAKANGVAAPV